MHCSHLEAYKDAKPVPTVCRTWLLLSIVDPCWMGQRSKQY